MRKYLFAIYGSLLGWMGCIEQIESPFSSEVIQRNLVVDGKIFPGNGPYYIHLRQIADFARDSLVEVNDARVSIKDEEDHTAEYSYIGEGRYELERGNFSGIEGKSYQIRIEWEGKRYQSEFATIPEAIPIDRIYVDFSFEAPERTPPTTLPIDLIKIFLDTSIPERQKGPYLRWELSEDFVLHEFLPPGSLKVPKSCYYHESINPQKILLYDGDRQNPGKKEGVLLGIKEKDWTFFYKHYFNVVQHSISQPAFEYWQRANQVINQVGSIFDTPPAGIQGNVFRTDRPEELVLGYFEATNPDTAHLELFRADFPLTVRVEGLCPSVFFYQLFNPVLPEACCRCEVLEGASLLRPYYWED